MADASSSDGNPYTSYLQQLHDSIYKSPDEGLQYRLYVLWGLAGLAFIGAIVHLTLIIVDTKRRKNDSLWLFKLVPRPNGRYIVTNAKLAHVICSFVCLILSIAAIWDTYNVFLRQGSFKGSGAFRSFPALGFGIHGWLVSWGQLQAYLLTPDHFNKHMISPAVANYLFLGLGAIVVLGIMAAAGALTALGVMTWDTTQIIETRLKELQASWTPGTTLNVSAILGLQPYATHIAELQDRVRMASFFFAPFATALVLIVLLVNVGSIALTLVVKSQIKLKLRNLSQQQTNMFADHTWTVDSLPASTREGLVGGTSTAAFTRSRVRQISRDGLGGQMEQARQIASLQKAERDLVLISSLVGSVAFVSVGLSAYGIYALVTDTAADASWPLTEFSMLSFFWVYPVALIISSAFFIWNACVHLPPAGGRRPSAGDTNSISITLRTGGEKAYFSHSTSQPTQSKTRTASYPSVDSMVKGPITRTEKAADEPEPTRRTPAPSQDFRRPSYSEGPMGGQQRTPVSVKRSSRQGQDGFPVIPVFERRSSHNEPPPAHLDRRPSVMDQSGFLDRRPSAVEQLHIPQAFVGGRPSLDRRHSSDRRASPVEHLQNRDSGSFSMARRGSYNEPQPSYGGGGEQRRPSYVELTRPSFSEQRRPSYAVDEGISPADRRPSDQRSHNEQQYLDSRRSLDESPLSPSAPRRLTQDNFTWANKPFGERHM